MSQGTVTGPMLFVASVILAAFVFTSFLVSFDLLQWQQSCFKVYKWKKKLFYNKFFKNAYFVAVKAFTMYISTIKEIRLQYNPCVYKYKN